jgi:hypothetical protein
MELCDLYRSLSTVRRVITKSLRWARNVVGLQEARDVDRILVGKATGSTRLEDQEGDGITLR